MKFHRIWAVVLRHLRLFTQINQIIWLFYWPLVDVILFGFTGVWFAQSEPSNATVGILLITGVVLWQLVIRATFEPSIDLIEELWSLNMLNLFATPLLVREWVIAILILAAITGAIVTTYCMAAAWVFYHVNILGFGPHILTFICLLFYSGLWVGFFSAAIVIYFGARAQSVVFMTNWILAPFTGALYPVSILPGWAQKISHFLPMTYAFNGIHTLATQNRFAVDHAVWCAGISSVYLALSLLFFHWLFNLSKQKGFARLSAD